MCERELETEQKLQYFDTTLMAVSVVSFSFSGCSTGGPGAHSAGFLYDVLSATSLDPNSSGGCPRGVMVKAVDCGIVVREFVLQSRYYIHFRALGKGMNLLILPAIG